MEEDEIVPLASIGQEVIINAIGREGLHKFQMRPTATVEQLKQRLIDKLRILPTKFVRIIYRDRVLEDGHTLESYSMTNNSFLHYSISDVLSQDLQRNIQNRVAEPDELRGFDRLRGYGFSDSDVEQIRTQFHTHRMVNSGFLNTNTSADYLRNLEDEWINNEANNLETSHRAETVVQLGGPQEEDRNPYGTYEDLIKGIAMGFFLSFIMLLWLPDQSLPSRTKAGIIVGFGASVCFGILRLIVF